MDFNEAAKLLLSAHYKFAKSMPKNPHWYMLVYDFLHGRPKFEELVQYLRDHSYPEKGFGKTWDMFLLNGYKYWSCGHPLPVTKLINRTHARLPEKNDKVWDSVHKKNRAREVPLLQSHFNSLDIRGKVLDVGYSAGLLLDYLQPPTVEDYIAIVPSTKQFLYLQDRHPKYREQFVPVEAANFYDTDYDTILYLYDPTSHWKPEINDRLAGYLTTGGNMYVNHIQQPA